MGLPGYADRMGLAFCLSKNTRAVTMAHWRSCDLWVRASSEVVAQRVVWLRDRGIDARGNATTPLSGSFPSPLDAGNSRPGAGLFHGAAKGVK